MARMKDLAVLSAESPNAGQKGKYLGNCNRESCQQPGATWVNLWRENEFYCENCARMIERANASSNADMLGAKRATFDGMETPSGAVGIWGRDRLILWDADKKWVNKSNVLVTGYELSDDEKARLVLAPSVNL